MEMFQSNYLAADNPAKKPVEKAIFRLYPPVGPCRSKTSPAKYRPGVRVDSIVFALTLPNSTPPTVTLASLSLNPTMSKANLFKF